MKKGKQQKYNEEKKQVVNEIHRNARINFSRRRYILKALNEFWQADLADMQKYNDENKGEKYILIVIDCFSKFVWAFPLKNKTGPEVSKAFEEILKHSKPPKNLQTDDGTEFYNKNFKKLMEKYNINHYSTFSEKKAAIVERVIRTLKGKMWKEFNLQGNYNWLKILPKIVENYNNSKHRTIGMKPVEVNDKNDKHLLNTVYSRIKTINYKNTYKIGDKVRISKTRGAFDKKYLPNWSTEIFTISDVLLTNPITYHLKDVNDEYIHGGFYKEQLQKVKYPHIYLVEKVLKRSKNKVYVKWLGLNNAHNSWINI